MNKMFLKSLVILTLLDPTPRPLETERLQLPIVFNINEAVSALAMRGNRLSPFLNALCSLKKFSTFL